MTTATPSQVPEARTVRPTAKQAAVTLIGGLVMAASTCGGALANFSMNGDTPAFTFFAVLFVVSIPVTITGIVLVIVRQVQLAMRRRAAREARPAAASASMLTPDDPPAPATIAGAAPTTPSNASSLAAPGVRVPAADEEAGAVDGWSAVVRATLAGMGSVGAFILMTVIDPNPAALIFLAAGLALAAASLVYFVMAGVRLLACR